ncbi:MAG: PQQ-dependent dehydrogenase, methanol/ethanol family, partial [Pseudomonadales bacterium]
MDSSDAEGASSAAGKAEKRSPAAVDANRLLGADSEPGNWMTHGRTYSEQRYSPLDKITTANVKDLGLAWSHDFGTKRGIEATSLVVDGVMYATSSWSIVHALDARTGELLWTYDPEVAKDVTEHACCDAVNRGVAIWQGQVFVGALDGRLIALDAATGKPNWEILTVDPERPYTITGAPRIIKGKVLIGNGGAEFGVRGYISAYNVSDGTMAWRFHTVPGNPDQGFENDTMEMAAKTWKGEWWKIGGGGTVWDSMAYDPDLNLLYIGVGNGTPWNQRLRSPGGGDNLFLSSIVALRPDTGEYVWHYQTTPGETWDYTAAQHIILAELELDGKPRKVLMQAPKNGFFYVLDRSSGELLSAENYINVTWATHIDMKTGRPVEVPEARYYDKEPFTVFPSYLGGHNWHPMSFNPQTGLVYIPVLDFPAVYGDDLDFEYRPDASNMGTDTIISGLPDAQAERDAMRPLIKGRLLAWDPVKQKEAWRVEHKGAWNGGTFTTAGGLVFQGTADGKFVAFRADNGDRLWEFAAQTGVVAPPIAYEIDGEQYVSVNVGWGGAFALVFGEFVQAESVPNVSRVLTFKLGAKGSLPKQDWHPTVVFNPPKQTANAETIKQ